MPGTTNFPGAMDEFPEIGPNTQEDEAGVEHDVVHQNVHASILAIQARVGVEGSEDPDSLEFRLGVVENRLDANLWTIFDGGGSPLAAGSFCYVRVPWDCDIKAYSLISDQPGSLVISVWKDDLVNFPPTISDSITGSNDPSLTAVGSKRDATLTGWTKALTKGQILAFTVQSCSVITWANLTLEVLKR